MSTDKTTPSIEILYKSKHGMIKQYAEWLAEELPGSALRELDNVQPADLETLDIVVVAGPTYMGGVGVKNFLQNNLACLKDKKVVVFTVGCFPADSEQSRKSSTRPSRPRCVKPSPSSSCPVACRNRGCLSESAW